MLTEERTTSKDTLVLGFDASCGKCSQMARQLKADVGGAVDILPLNNPDMREWRNQALEDAPWMPTLVRVGPDGKATGGWVGWKIGPALGARLGPQKAAKALQNIGEQRLEANGGRIGAWTRSPVSRRGLGRVAVGMAGLAAGAVTVAGMAGSAFAKGTTPNLRVQDQEDLSTEDAVAQLERQMKSDDVSNVLPLSKMSAKTPAGAASGDAESTEIGAKRMALADGSQVSMTYRFDRATGELLVIQENTELVDGLASAAWLVDVDENAEDYRESTFQIREQSANGAILRHLDDVPDAEGRSMLAQAQAGSDPCGGCRGGTCRIGGEEFKESCRSSSVVSCVLSAAGCALCVGCSGTAMCIGCAITSCGGVLLSCCNEKVGPACMRCTRVC